MDEKNIENKDVEKKINVEGNKEVEKKSKVKNNKDAEKKADVEKNVNAEANTDIEKEADSKKKKVITFSVVGIVAVIAIIVALILVIGMIGKPSKSKSEELINDYLKAANDSDGDKFAKLIDVKGYIIFKEEGEKKFDKKYKDKEKYIKDYLDDKNYDDISDAKDAISSTFKSQNSYSSKEYSLKEITKVEKSSKSKKISVIKAKVKVKSKYSSSSDTKTMKLYVIKADKEYKIVGAELD